MRKLSIVRVGVLVVFLWNSGRPAAAREPELQAYAKEVKLLEQAFDNLDIFWGLNIQDSEAYAETHNLVQAVARQVPEAQFFPISMPAPYVTQCVTFAANTRRLAFAAACPTLSEPVAELLARAYLQSQKLFAQHYTTTFQPLAEKLNRQLQEAVRREPDSALGDFTRKLDAIFAYLDKLRTKPEVMDVPHFIETRDILTDAEILLQLEAQIRQILKNDVSFAPGKYLLPDFVLAGQQALTGFITQLLAIKTQYPLQYPGQPLLLTIKTVGYTDEVPVSDPELISALMHNVAAETLPSEELARRQFLNRRLSEFRARTVNEYAQAELQRLAPDDPTRRVDAVIVGRGEELPALEADAPAYLTRDPRRRICKISVTFQRQSPPSLFGKTTF